MIPAAPLAFAAVVLLARAWIHAYQPHRLDHARGDRRLDQAYSRASLVLKHAASWLLVAAAARAWATSRPVAPAGSLRVAREVAGVALALLGMGIRQWAMRALGRYFTFELGIRPDHALVTAGPYRWVMHPAYTGTLLVELGVALFFGAWRASAPLVAASVVFFALRIRAEERVLRAAFGDRFRAYARARSRLVPGVY